jgi:hypothetical protein
VLLVLVIVRHAGRLPAFAEGLIGSAIHIAEVPIAAQPAQCAQESSDLLERRGLHQDVGLFLIGILKANKLPA